ncbi:hypothetical protein JRO89_XS10G0082800 [Xanthoceras sorbifolium]|uniref:Uncharacterized protein n=1 Tax=Xanthoceras sorbifolium TaxID=99658 RepID=A0ABQ8HI13_9ROSI|nr:hypothetical protein JRO89_XS10G0082800 [Xanthoceras sorbifolium]
MLEKSLKDGLDRSQALKASRGSKIMIEGIEGRYAERIAPDLDILIRTSGETLPEQFPSQLRGRLRNIRPLALTTAATPILMLAHINEKNRCLKSFRTAEKTDNKSRS